MHLKISASFEDSTTTIKISSIEDLEKILPAFINNENDIIKAQTLAKQLNKIIKNINALLD